VDETLDERAVVELERRPTEHVVRRALRLLVTEIRRDEQPLVRRLVTLPIPAAFVVVVVLHPEIAELEQSVDVALLRPSEELLRRGCPHARSLC